MHGLYDLLAQAKVFLDIPLVTLGTTPLTVWTLLQVVALIILLAYLSRKLRHWIVDQLPAKTRMERGVRKAIVAMGG